MTQWLLTKLNAKSTNKILIIDSNNDFYQKLYHYNIILYEKYSELENPDIIIIFCNNMSELQLKMSEYITNIYILPEYNLPENIKNKIGSFFLILEI